MQLPSVSSVFSNGLTANGGDPLTGVPPLGTGVSQPDASPIHLSPLDLIERGGHHARQGQWYAAERCFRDAIALTTTTHPHWAIAHQNLAEVLRHQGRFTEANEHYRQAILGWKEEGKGKREERGVEIRWPNHPLAASTAAPPSTLHSPPSTLHPPLHSLPLWNRLRTLWHRARHAARSRTPYRIGEDGSVFRVIDVTTSSQSHSPGATVPQLLTMPHQEKSQGMFFARFFPSASRSSISAKDSGGGGGVGTPGMNGKSPHIAPHTAPHTEDASLVQSIQHCLDSGDVERAIALSQQVLIQHPQSAQGYLMLGQARQANNQIDQAIQCYQQAIALQPTLTPAYTYLGQIYLDQNQTTAAIELYQQALTLQSPTPTPHTDPKSKIQNPKSPPPDPQSPIQNPQSKIQHANTLAESKQFAQAISLYRQVIDQQLAAQEPEADTYRLLGNALQGAGQLDAAQDAYLEAARLQPNDAAIQANLGTVAAKQQRWPDAVQHYRRSLELDPEVAGVYRNLAKVFEQLGETQRATLCWYRAFVLEPDQATATDLVRIGDRFSAQQEWDRAGECYRLALQQDGELLAAYLGLGQGLEQQGKWQEAIAVYRQLLSVHPTVPGVPEKLVQALLVVERSVEGVDESADDADGADKSADGKEKEDVVAERFSESSESLDNAVLEPEVRAVYDRGVAALAGQDWEGAIAAFREAIALCPDGVPVLNGLGDGLRQLEQWDEAVTIYERLVALEPGAFWSWAKLGDVRMALGRFESAADAYRQVAELNPEFFWGHNGLGDALRHLGRWDEAAAAYQRGIEIDHEFFWSHNNLGDVLMQAGQPEQAVGAYRRAIALDDKAKGIHGKLGTALREAAQAFLREAAECYRREILNYPDDVESYHLALDLNPNDADLYGRLGDALAAQGDVNQAIAFYQVGLQVCPEEGTLVARLGKMAESQEQWEAAMGYYRKAMELCPQEGEYAYRLGRVLERVGQGQEAAGAYRQAVILSPEMGDAHERLAGLLVELEEWDGAMLACRRAVELNGENGWLFKLLGDLYARRGQVGEASGAYRKAIQLGYRDF